MKLRIVAAAVLIASSMGASANNYPFAMPLAPMSPFPGTAPVSAAGSFSDNWSFTAPANAATVSGSAISLDIASFFNIDNIALSLFTSGGVLIASAPSGSVGSSLENIGVMAGSDYYFNVTGNVTNPPSKGFYAFNAVSAVVPEPETYAMMLAGLGALGFLALRRKR